MTKEEYAANIREAVQDAAREAFEHGCLNNSQVQIVLANKVTTQQFKTVLQSMHDTTIVKAPGSHLPSSPSLLSAVAEQQVLLAQKQKYPWDQLTPIEHESIVSRFTLTSPQVDPFWKDRMPAEKCVDLLHVDDTEEYRMYYNTCKHGHRKAPLFGLDHDSEEVEVAQDVGFCRCGHEPRYAFAFQNYHFLQQFERSPFYDYFKIWKKRGQQMVYDASTAGFRQFTDGKIRISRPRCSGKWFYMIVYDAKPRLIKVDFEGFQEEVIISEAAAITDFWVDHDQTITYLMNQTELRQARKANYNISNSVLNLEEPCEKLYAVADDLFVSVNPEAKSLVLSDPKAKLDRYLVWMVQSKLLHLHSTNR